MHHARSRLVKEPLSPCLPSVGVVVCPSDHLSAAMGGISPEWIVQCLIEGRKMENYQFYLYNSK